MKNLSVRLLVLAGALVPRPRRPSPGPTAASASSTRVRAARGRSTSYRSETWRWQSLMRKPRTPTLLHASARTATPRISRWVRDLWQRRAARAERQAKNPPHRAQWLCIHRYERHPAQGWARTPATATTAGCRWTSRFQRAYGPELLRRKGTANSWTAVEQMWVAERAYRSGRGFYPWPNTARYCGLI